MSLHRLRAALVDEGGTLAATLCDAEALPATPAADADGPDPARTRARIRGHEADYEILLGMIREGARLHYGHPRVVCTDDPDLALLLGDQLYALGLTRLAALGDTEAVADLGDAISLVAQAEAGGEHELAEAVWQAGVTAVTRGRTGALERAKRMVREGDPRALQALREASESGPSGRGSRDARRDVDDTLHTPFN